MGFRPVWASDGLKTTTERIQTMKRSTMIRGLAALAVCALLPVVMASQKNPVPRPFKMQAHSQMVVSLADYSFVATAWGEATHCGKCVSLGWGLFNPLAPASNRFGQDHRRQWRRDLLRLSEHDPERHHWRHGPV
jgi:hypothetical protein